MFYANFKQKSFVNHLRLLGFLLLFNLNSVTFNTEKAGSPRQVTRFRSLILANQIAVSIRPLLFELLADFILSCKFKVSS